MTDKIPADWELKIGRLTLVPGDVLVIQVHKTMPDWTLSRVHQYFQSLTPNGVKVMVIDQTVELSVLTKAQIEAKTNGE